MGFRELRNSPACRMKKPWMSARENSSSSYSRRAKLLNLSDRSSDNFLKSDLVRELFESIVRYIFVEYGKVVVVIQD